MTHRGDRGRLREGSEPARSSVELDRIFLFRSQMGQCYNSSTFDDHLVPKTAQCKKKVICIGLAFNSHCRLIHLLGTVISITVKSEGVGSVCRY